MGNCGTTLLAKIRQRMGATERRLYGFTNQDGALPGRSLAQKGLSKTDRRTIANLITELAGELVAARNDPKIKAIYNGTANRTMTAKKPPI